MAGVQRLDMTGVQKLYMTPTGVQILVVSRTGMQRLGMTGVKNLGVDIRCVKIGQDTDMHTNIRCETYRCANIEPETNSHGTTIKQVK